MSRVFVTGSADGLGLMAARLLIQDGHEVVLHARSEQRGHEALASAPGASTVLVGDLSSIDQTRELASDANLCGRFDAVIHNAGVGYRESRRETIDGLEHVFAINVLAPYLLTALMDRPDRLVYLSSGMHQGGDPDFADLQWERRRWNGAQAYSDSKLMDTALAFIIAGRWPGVAGNAVEPGWVATKMGGPGAPDDLALAPLTQVWLAVAQEAADITGGYFYHQRPRNPAPLTSDEELHQLLIESCASLTGVSLSE
jgi:NAD(P)-dependent dehydrogenase (short-subunit alcohol dehydrogenase family)